MSGYLEDLSVAQQQTLTEFKEKILAEFPVYFPSRNDRECLRFLRARKFDLEKSLLMYRNFLVSSSFGLVDAFDLLCVYF